MKNILFCLFIFVLISMSCDKDKTIHKDTFEICGVDNPLENLEWLKNMKNSITNCSCQMSILEGKYSKGIVYYLVMNDPVCNSVFGVTLIDCNGALVKEYKSDEFNIFADEVETIRSIYTCDK